MGAGGRTAMLNPFTKKKQSKKRVFTSRQDPRFQKGSLGIYIKYQNATKLHAHAQGFSALWSFFVPITIRLPPPPNHQHVDPDHVDRYADIFMNLLSSVRRTWASLTEHLSPLRSHKHRLHICDFGRQFFHRRLILVGGHTCMGWAGPRVRWIQSGLVGQQSTS